jgi:MFS family permease
VTLLIDMRQSLFLLCCPFRRFYTLQSVPLGYEARRVIARNQMQLGANAMSQLQNPSINGETTTGPRVNMPPRPASLWRNRDYMLLWSGQNISSIGTQVSVLAFPLLALFVTHSAAQAGLIAALRGLPYAIFMLPAGALIDHWDRKRVMILCDSGRALALGSIPVALILGRLTIPQLYLVSLIEGTLFTFFNLAETACLARVVPKEQYAAATAQNQVTDSLAWLLGPSLGGVLYGIGRAIPFLTDAISYMVSVLSLFFIRTKFQEEREAAPIHLWADIGEGLKWLWHHPVLRFVALLTGGITTPVVGYALIIIVLAQSQHASPLAIGLIFGCSGIGSILGALVAGPLQKRFKFGLLMIISTWIWALTWLLFAIAPNPLVLGLVTALSFIIVPIYTVVQFSYRLAQIPDKLQGRVNSVFRLIAFGSQPIGMAITGLLIQAIGPILTVIVLFIPQLVLSIAATFNKELRSADSPGEKA